MKDQIAALVHPDALACPVEQARHEAFIAARLLLSLAAIVVVPPYLIYHGLPTPWEAIAFSWLVFPLISVVYVSRTGRLAEAEALSLVSIVGIVVAMTLSGAAFGAALSWLLIVPLEAAVAGRSSLILAGAAAALTACAGIVMAHRLGFQPGPGHGSVAASAMFAIPGIIYATGLALTLQHLGDLYRQLERSSSARHDDLSDVVGDLVLRLDRSGSVLAASSEAASLFGLPPHELADRGLFERVHVADRPAFLKAVADAAAAAAVTKATVRLRRSSMGRDGFGEPVFAWADMRFRKGAADAQGTETLTAAVRDVTASKTNEHALEAIRSEAERSTVLRHQYLANVSHELRTPLNAIVGFAEMLSSEQLSPKDAAKQREYARIIHSSGQHLLAVVNAILDMSKIESGSFDILAEPFDIDLLIESCCDMVRLKAEQASVRLVRNCSPLLPEVVADKRACKQILINLLSNALKFTPPNGCVTVAALADGDDVVLSVHDTGIGITARDLPRLGDPFFQAHGNYDRHFEGTGLGLSVVRGLVGLHGGSLSIESASGAGTSVSVRLPLDCRRAPRAARGVARIDTIHRRNNAEISTPDFTPKMVQKIA